MLNIENIQVEFDSKKVFCHASFKAYKNECTIIIGKSGSGKTTLFRCILGELSKESSYFFDEQDIRELKNKEEFFMNHISYASQKPTFIADLTMQEQIDLLKTIYKSKQDITNLIQLLSLNDLLNCYPNQCSGGEKSRFAFILALLKNVDIYLFDEPTSSLDDIQTNQIINIIQELKKHGKMVIISTHDHRLIEKGDRVIEIKNNQLNIIKETRNCDLGIFRKHDNQQYELQRLDNVWGLLSNHHKLYSRTMNIVCALGITLSLIGIQFGNVINDNFDSNSSENKSTVIIVNKKIFEKQGLMFDPEGALPLSNEEYEYIKDMKYVKNISPFFYFAYENRNYIEKDEAFSNDGKHYVVNQIDDLNITTILNNEEHTVDSLNSNLSMLNFYTYQNNIDYKDDLLEIWNDEGLYVSQDFYRNLLKPYIHDEKDKQEIRVRVPLLIPVYNSIGGAHVDENVYAKENKYTSALIYREYKIKGITKENSLIDSNITSQYFLNSSLTMGLSINEYLNDIQEYKKNTGHTCFLTRKTHEFICDKPYDKELHGEVIKNFVDTPFAFNTVSVEADNLDHVYALKQQLLDTGFAAYNNVVDYNTFQEVQENVKGLVLILTSTTFCLITLMNILLKLNNKRDEMSFQCFFKEKNFTNKMIKTLNKQRFKYNCFTLLIYVVLEYCLFNVVLFLTTKTLLLGNYKVYILAILLIITTEYFIPLCLESYYLKRSNHYVENRSLNN